MSRWTLALAVILAATLSPSAETNSKPSAPRSEVTTWSRSAHRLPYALSANPEVATTRIPSPNGKYEIACNSMPHETRVSASVSERLQEPSCEFIAGGKRLPIDLEVGPEALWAPDSDAVAITNSNGGAVGTYRVLIYRPESSGPVELASAVRQDLARRFPACAGTSAGCTPEQRRKMQRDVSWVNVAAIRWMEKSDRLLMLAWVPDSSEFGSNLGRYNGYIVDAHSGRVLNRYSEEEFKKRFRKYCGDWGL